MTGGTHTGPYYKPTVLQTSASDAAYDLEIFGRWRWWLWLRMKTTLCASQTTRITDCPAQCRLESLERGLREPVDKVRSRPHQRSDHQRLCGYSLRRDGCFGERLSVWEASQTWDEFTVAMDDGRRLAGEISVLRRSASQMTLRGLRSILRSRGLEECPHSTERIRSRSPVVRLNSSTNRLWFFQSEFTEYKSVR